MDKKLADALVAIPAERFKIALLAWMAESEHQGWDGFEKGEVLAFECLMNDFTVYAENGGLEVAEGHFTFGSHVIDAAGNGDT